MFSPRGAREARTRFSFYGDTITGECTVLVYAVDSNDRDRIEEAEEETHQSAERGRDVRCGGCWFSTNKQDLLKAVMAAEVIEKSGFAQFERAGNGSFNLLVQNLQFEGFFFL